MNLTPINRAMLDSTSWIPFAIVAPLAGAVLTFLFRRYVILLGLAATTATPVVVAMIIWNVVRQGLQRYPIGGWGAPLGIDLYADGLAVFMLLMTSLVGLTTSLYAVGYFRDDDGLRGGRLNSRSRERAFFWPLWMFMWAALNALILSADVFNLYVTLELLGLSAVALVALEGKPVALVAAMRYLLVSLLGSLVYLLGVSLLYGAFGTLDLVQLGQTMTPEPSTRVAMALMMAGLALKTALFPMHFWLPNAHANAPAPVSALLSALVVKASFYILLRLWFQVFSNVATPIAAQFLGFLGAAAIIWGSAQALLALRLKQLVAYSTVAQIGYLFLVFPLAQTASASFTAWNGGLYFVLSHACAKAALFLAAGTILRSIGHDRLSEMEGLSQSLPFSSYAFAVAGLSLMGLPPSGGFIAKWMLINAAVASGQWYWVAVILTGGLLTAAYVFRVFSRLFKPAPLSKVSQPVPRIMELMAFFLSLVALALGLNASKPLALLQPGAPVSGEILLEGLHEF